MSLNLHLAADATHVVIDLKVRGIPRDLLPLVDHVDQLEAEIDGIESVRNCLGYLEDAAKAVLAYWKLHGTDEWEDEVWASKLAELELWS